MDGSNEQISPGIAYGLTLICGLFVILVWSFFTWKLSASFGIFVFILAFVISNVIHTFVSKLSLSSLFLGVGIFLFLSSIGILLNAWILNIWQYELSFFSLDHHPDLNQLTTLFGKMFHPVDILIVSYAIYYLVTRIYKRPQTTQNEDQKI